MKNILVIAAVGAGIYLLLHSQRPASRAAPAPGYLPPQGPARPQINPAPLTQPQVDIVPGASNVGWTSQNTSAAIVAGGQVASSLIDSLTGDDSEG